MPWKRMQDRDHTPKTKDGAPDPSTVADRLGAPADSPCGLIFVLDFHMLLRYIFWQTL